MSVSEAASSYAALILHDEGIKITAENITKIVKAANVKVDSYWPAVLAKLFERRSVGDLIANVGAGGGVAAAGAGPAAAAASAAPAAAAPVVEKEEVKEEESDDDMGFSLFD